MSTGLEVTKALWTDADFVVMGWHDNAVHAIALEPAPEDPGCLLLDIDYIVQWESCAVPRGDPVRGGLSFDQLSFAG